MSAKRRIRGDPAARPEWDHAASARGKQLLESAQEAFQRTSYAEALDDARRAIDRCRAEGDELGEALALGWAGAALTQQSKYDAALGQLQAALERLALLGRDDLGGRSLNYMAIVHEELGDVDEAFRLYHRGLEIARRGGQSELAGRILANIGDAHINLGEHERALPYLEEGAALLLAAGERALYGWAQWGIGRIHSERGEDDDARRCFETAVTAAEGASALRTQAEGHAGLGTHYTKLGQAEPALHHLYRSLELATRGGIKREMFKTHLALAQAHEKFGDHERALAHFKAFHEVRAEVFDEVLRAKVASLTASLQLEKARHEREISQLRNVELAAALSQLEQQAQALAWASVRDSLTGIYNRRYLDQRLPEELAACRQSGRPLTVAIADVDHFKQINDHLSHAVGDRTLKAVAEEMGRLLRGSDLVARYGGEEFVLVFPGTELAEAVAVCERLRHDIETRDWAALHPRLKVTASFGVATAGDGAGADELPDWERVLVAADEQLYRAKLAGRNRVCCQNPVAPVPSPRLRGEGQGEGLP